MLRISQRLTCAVIAAASLSTMPAMATELDLNLNDDAVRLSVAWPFRDQVQLYAGGLTHQDRGELIHIGGQLVDVAASGSAPLTAGLGGRFVFASPDAAPDDEFMLALGGFVKYVFPTANRFSVMATAHYAPDVLGFGDVEQLIDVTARVSYNVLRDADIYLGARYVSIEIENVPDITLDNGLVVGFQFRF